MVINMKYRFNETNNITGYIKELLKEFNLPTYKVYREGMTLNEGRLYIRENYIYKCINGELKKVWEFWPNKKILNCTTTMKLNSSVYDNYTHEYFGRYLRFIRDYYYLNLMPLYNCFSYATPLELIYNINISPEDTSEENKKYFRINTEDNHYNYYLVPVVFDQEYTIAIDSTSQYELSCLIYTGNDLLEISKDLIKKSYKCIAGSLFKRPYIYKTPFAEGETWSYEKDLKLLIKLPKKSKTSITVLEGNYLQNSEICGNVFVPEYNYQISNLSNTNTASSKGFNPPSKLSLLRCNDGTSYPFADRLVEYLLQNAITHLDTISGNIERVQDALYYNTIFKGHYGLWDLNVKYNIYKNCINRNCGRNQTIIYSEDQVQSDTKNNLFKNLRFIDLNEDLLYYVDKDVESLIDTINMYTSSDEESSEEESSEEDS